MSHFLTLVLVEDLGTPPGKLLRSRPQSVLAEVERLLAPYDEAIEVAPYEEPCFCVGRDAEHAGIEHADRTVGTFDAKRAEFRDRVLPRLMEGSAPGERPSEKELDAAWREFTAEFRAAYEQAALAGARAHPMFEKPDPGCDECVGSGVRSSTYNPDSKWDWWTVGGRWDGIVAHGVFRDGAERGLLEHNAAPVAELRENILEHVHAIVTPDGGWHERGSMGWWGIVHEPKSDGAWMDEAARLLLARRGAVAVGCDLHI